MKNREQKIKALLAHNLIPTVDIYCPDWDGSFQYFAELIEPQLGDRKNHLDEDPNNDFSDYFKALDYAIDKGFQRLKKEP